MTAHEYRDALERLSLTAAGGAKLLGVSEQQSRRWAHAGEDVPEPVARFLTYLIKARIRPDEVTQILAATGSPRLE
jgi:hypothetical protein